jgi:hypothetical protein
MKIHELLSELRSNPAQNIKVSVSQQVQDIIKKYGGTIDDYWIHNSAVDHLGFFGGDKNAQRDYWTSPRTTPMKAPVVPGKAFSKQLQYTSAERGGVAPKGGESKHGLWFSPLKPNLQFMDGGNLPFSNNFTFLIKLNDDAWLQPINLAQKVRTNLIGINPPEGKHKVGQYNPSSHIAVLFEPAFKVVGKWTQEEIQASGARTRSSPDQQKQAGMEKYAQRGQLNKDLDDLF